MDNSRNFYISAFIAFGSYFFLIILFLVYLTFNNVEKFDSFSKNTVLELDIVMEENKIETVKHFKSQRTRKDSKIAKKVVKKSTSTSAKQRSDLKSLFAKVKTKARVVKKQKISNVKKSSMTSRFKSKFEKQKQTTNKSLSKLLDSQKLNNKKKNTGDAKNASDKYISKIYELLHNRWQPLLIVDGLSTKVIITIDSDGGFGYKILQYSGDDSFDNQLVLFLEEQKNEIFPKPEKSLIEIEVIFTAKG